MTVEDGSAQGLSLLGSRDERDCGVAVVKFIRLVEAHLCCARGRCQRDDLHEFGDAVTQRWRRRPPYSSAH